LTILGVDLHKRCHTAVALDDVENELARIEVRATRRQLTCQRLIGAREESVCDWPLDTKRDRSRSLLATGAPEGPKHSHSIVR
jgi:hypothetical protein